MTFYDFLWEAVRNPQLIVTYAKDVGVSPPPPPQEFYQRLRYVAELVVVVLEREKGDDLFWLRRCVEAKRFYNEARQDLAVVGHIIPEFGLC
ncbi:MAG: hypothetical protein QXP31_11775, partial [Pyrobaculum sp.]